MDYKVVDAELTSIADAIRIKGGTSSQLTFPNGILDFILEIVRNEHQCIYNEQRIELRSKHHQTAFWQCAFILCEHILIRFAP